MTTDIGAMAVGNRRSRAIRQAGQDRHPSLGSLHHTPRPQRPTAALFRDQSARAAPPTLRRTRRLGQKKKSHQEGLPIHLKQEGTLSIPHDPDRRKRPLHGLFAHIREGSALQTRTGE